jgi:hypothetical protein
VDARVRGGSADQRPPWVEAARRDLGFRGRSPARSKWRSTSPAARSCGGFSASKRNPSEGNAAARLHVGTQDQSGSGDVLQHRPHGFQQRIGRGPRSVHGIRRREIDPSHDAADEAIALARHVEQKRVSATVGAACTSTTVPTPAAAASGDMSRACSRDRSAPALA